MSHEQELRHIRALSEIVESGQRCWKRVTARLDVDGSGVPAEACPPSRGIGAAPPETELANWMPA